MEDAKSMLTLFEQTSISHRTLLHSKKTFTFHRNFVTGGERKHGRRQIDVDPFRTNFNIPSNTFTFEKVAIERPFPKALTAFFFTSQPQKSVCRPSSSTTLARARQTKGRRARIRTRPDSADCPPTVFLRARTKTPAQQLTMRH